MFTDNLDAPIYRGLKSGIQGISKIRGNLVVSAEGGSASGMKSTGKKQCLEYFLGVGGFGEN